MNFKCHLYHQFLISKVSSHCIWGICKWTVHLLNFMAAQRVWNTFCWYSCLFNPCNIREGLAQCILCICFIMTFFFLSLMKWFRVVQNKVQIILEVDYEINNSGREKTPGLRKKKDSPVPLHWWKYLNPCIHLDLQWDMIEKRNVTPEVEEGANLDTQTALLQSFKSWPATAPPWEREILSWSVLNSLFRSVWRY